MDETEQQTLKWAPTAIAVIATDGSVLYANEALFRLWRADQAEFYGDPLNAGWQLSGMPSRILAQSFVDNEWRGEMELRRSDGTPFMASIAARRIDAGEGAARHIIVSVTDITQRKAEQERIERLTRMYAAISLTIETTIKATTPEELLGEICRIAVSEGGVTKAWAGLLDEQSQTVRPLVYCGMAPEYVATLRIPLDPSTPEGRGPSATAMRSGKPVIVDDLRNSPITQPWKELVHIESLHCAAFFPLRREGQICGVIVFLGGIHGLFTNEMVALLDRMARDISFALDRMDALRQSERLQENLEENVRQRTAELEAALRELETFNYSVSHDLRAPLRAISGFTALAMEQLGNQPGKAALSYLERVRDRAAYMGHLMDALIDLSRVSRTQLARSHIDLAALARVSAEHLQQDEPGRQAVFDIPASICVEADEALLQVVVQNLLSNAWKFTAKRKETRISIGALDQDGVPVYFVQDNGAGFDMKSAGKLFHAFQRLHTEADFRGTGIGLATVQRIIQRHGGQIWAESSPDAGATFYFTLQGN